MANSEIIGAGQDTARRAPKKILDVCCGGRSFWFDKNHHLALYLDKRDETITYLNQQRKEYSVRIKPDRIGDFTNIEFSDNSFNIVVFDPPHFVANKPTGHMHKKYGTLNGDWRNTIRRGFSECFRVLKPNGVLVFKWNESVVPLREILTLTEHNPLFGNRKPSVSKTHWLCFMKPDDINECIVSAADNWFSVESSATIRQAFIAGAKWAQAKESPVLGEEGPAQDTMEICHTAPNSASPKAAQISMELGL